MTVWTLLNVNVCVTGSAMVHLYEVWQKDPATAQPQRAQVGTTNAINAHNRGRKLALAWNPPSCESNK